MTDAQKLRLQREAAVLIDRIRELRTAQTAAALAGTRSATISAGGNSQSVTNIGLDELVAEIARLERMVKAIYCRLNGRGGIRHILPDFIEI